VLFRSVGTLLMTNQVYRLNPGQTRDTLLATLHQAFNFDKLILVPRLRVEETGHVDLLIKMASADTLLISAPDALFTADRLRAAHRQLSRTTNARGERYQLASLPTPPLYLNWFGFPIRRSYTNALTANGRVLVPVYGVHTDDLALRTYEQAMPGYDIYPIDCTTAVNGGGAVHCMTKEVPAVG
jgi:agmatine deiminase